MRQMKEIATILESQNYSLNNSICDMLKKFNFKTLCHKSGIKKEAGFSTIEIITLLILLPIIAVNSVHQLYKSSYSKQAAMQEDTIYRLKNNEKHSWRSLLYSIAKAFKEKVNTKKEPESNSDANIKAFIKDDTPDQRTGYKITDFRIGFNRHMI